MIDIEFYREGLSVSEGLLKNPDSWQFERFSKALFPEAPTSYDMNKIWNITGDYIVTGGDKIAALELFNRTLSRATSLVEGYPFSLQLGDMSYFGQDEFCIGRGLTGAKINVTATNAGSVNFFEGVKDSQIGAYFDGLPPKNFGNFAINSIFALNLLDTDTEHVMCVGNHSTKSNFMLDGLKGLGGKIGVKSKQSTFYLSPRDKRYACVRPNVVFGLGSEDSAFCFDGATIIANFPDNESVVTVANRIPRIGRNTVSRNGIYKSIIESLRQAGLIK